MATRKRHARPRLRSSSPATSGEPWTPSAWQNWRNRHYSPAAKAAGIANPRPYDLRHSFVSLLIHEGRSVVEVARQAGHAPTMTLATYAHVFDEFDVEDRLPVEEQIRRARAERVPVSYLSAADEKRDDEKDLQTDSGRCPARTGDLLLVRQALYQLS